MSKEFELSMLEKIRAYQTPMRRLSHNLTPTELVVIMRLVDLTYGWGRTEYFTTDREILGGRVAADGEAFLAPLNISKSALKRARARLRDLGYIFYETDPYRNRTRYEVNFDMISDEELWRTSRMQLTGDLGSNEG